MKVSVGLNADRTEFELPDTIDVLIHLPESLELRNKKLCVAHAIQYNISAKGLEPEEALTKLVRLVAVHCKLAMEDGIDPVIMAAESYKDAWHNGVPMESAARQKISVRLSQEFAETLQEFAETLSTNPLGNVLIDVRDVRAKQEAHNMATVDELMASHA